MTVIDAQPTSELATRRYEPRSPVGDARGLKSLLEASKVSIMQALPRHITPERLIKTMLVAANRTPKLFECTQSSVLETINRAAELGLDLSGTLGEAYPVPYGNVCTLIIGYRGLEKLAWQSGEIASIDAEVVYEKDTFKFKKGTEVTVEWEPYLKADRGAVVGAYACVTMKSGGKLARFLPVSEIEKVRKVSKSGNSGPWTQWWDEMARKTALRRVLKDAPLSTEKFTAAMETEADDTRFSDVVEAETNAPRGQAALVDKLRNRQNGGAKDPYGQPLTVGEMPESEAEAERVLQEKAAQTRDASSTTTTASPAADEPDAQDGGGVEEDQTQQVRGIPPHGRTSDSWIDDVVLTAKPDGMAANIARKKFHASHAPASWAKLAHEEQDRLFTLLVSGEFDWK